MRHTPATPIQPARGFRSARADSAIEWEELPSLADSLSTRLVSLGLRRDGSAPAGRAWDATMPADLDALPPPRPFREPLAGCAVREVDDHDVFRHFFGD